MKPLFRIKICGITCIDDAQAAVAAGADAIGLNFYPGTSRCVSVDAAAEIRSSIPKGVCCVGVFVNAPVEEVASTAARLNLDAVQLHGDEPVEYLQDLRVNGGWSTDVPVIRAFRCRDNGYDEMSRYVGRASLAAALVDAHVEGKYGGAGETIDWSEFRAARPLFPTTALILAGGLTPDNVARAIAAGRPDAVDVASGVESSPGKKDAELMRRFVKKARDGFASLDGTV